MAGSALKDTRLSQGTSSALRSGTCWVELLSPPLPLHPSRPLWLCSPYPTAFPLLPSRLHSFVVSFPARAVRTPQCLRPHSLRAPGGIRALPWSGWTGPRLGPALAFRSKAGRKGCNRAYSPQQGECTPKRRKAIQTARDTGHSHRKGNACLGSWFPAAPHPPRAPCTQTKAGGGSGSSPPPCAPPSGGS